MQNQLKMKWFVVLWFVTSIFLLPENVFSEEGFGDSNRSVTEGLMDGYDSPISQNQQDNETLVQTSQNEQSYIGMLFQMFVALGVVIALIYGLLKLFNKRNMAHQAHSAIKNAGGVNIGPNRSVQLIQVGERILIVGVGENVQLLKEISDKQEVDKLLEDHRPQDAFDIPLNKASHWLRQSFNAKKDTKHSFSSMLNENLKSVKDTHNKLHTTLKEKK
ncbi:flagellar biosynthetic protein FliO [Alteribacter aurantiacus]|uniref:flagellar biosynthetic protein FliO n=1 Tax=Alteribacter aurantiacus TaxID=254410 RepID=UPI000410DEF3|nr:flagellar biosynthetic protein FliO [Alteribacter aurantiacus]